MAPICALRGARRAIEKAGRPEGKKLDLSACMLQAMAQPARFTIVCAGQAAFVCGFAHERCCRVLLSVTLGCCLSEAHSLHFPCLGCTGLLPPLRLIVNTVLCCVLRPCHKLQGMFSFCWVDQSCLRQGLLLALF